MSAEINVSTTLTSTGQHRAIVTLDEGGPWWPPSSGQLRMTRAVDTEAQALSDGLEVARTLLSAPAHR